MAERSEAMVAFPRDFDIHAALFRKPESTLQTEAEVFPVIFCVYLRSVGDLLAKWKRGHLVPGTKPGIKPGKDF